ncbi:MAG: hypothetical protein A2Y62_15765 [Candidatus Fischerbacteria bacterium RBG_13_37_8]|uniref:Uncharacterized protein n=1 Tax=Candidatus Fischerbacteria bacterium RBG_13_37_8 TaxID=1817863 RepID=A0A1F5VWV1_9BACT|nr:MAG: hypothetical protein A2Y62_15765 [Candidatus Fischerbacteria bacterium RBG_13_37_8]
MYKSYKIFYVILAIIMVTIAFCGATVANERNDTYGKGDFLSLEQRIACKEIIKKYTGSIQSGLLKIKDQNLLLSNCTLKN